MKSLNLPELIERFQTLSQRFQKVFAEETANWDPEPVPDFMLVSAFGRTIGEDIGSFDESERLNIFLLIEAGVSSDDARVSTAITTGLVEAMISSSVQFPGRWDVVKSYMGTESVIYAEAWLNQDEPGNPSA
ncbi:MAG: hypothetical protein IPK50_02000 [Fibrobacterota bacterium]|nr:MAG: hypothetical protein IPK50_02000 [Fibrobacterota bacterium]